MISIWFVVGIITTALFVLGSLFAIWIGFAGKSDGEWDYEFPLYGGIFTLVATLALAAWGFWPYDMQYHRYRHVDGAVEVAEARMLADGSGGTSQVFAVRFKETGDTYRCDDSRCSLLKPGDYLSLWCIREWEYASTPGWTCRFDKTTPAPGGNR